MLFFVFIFEVQNLLSEILFRTDFSKILITFKFQLPTQFNNYINIHALVCLPGMIVGLKLHNFSLNIISPVCSPIRTRLSFKIYHGTTICY